MGHVTNTTTSQLIYNPATEPSTAVVRIRALSGGPHYVGPSGVTTSNGLPLQDNDELVLHAPAVALYAVSSKSGTLDVSIGE